MTHLKICRLCLQPVCKDNFLLLENVKDMLGELLLNLNFDVVKDPMVCNTCAMILQNSWDFKSACANNVDVKSLNSQYEKLCRFCLKIEETSCLIYLREAKKDLSMTEKLITCEICLNLLKTMYSFIVKCINTEDKIKTYVELEGTDDVGQIDLNYIQEIKPIKTEIICDNLKEENTESFCGNLDGTKSVVKVDDVEEECLAMEFKNEEIDIKSEQCSIDSYADTTTPQPDLADRCNLCSSELEMYCSHQQSEYENHLKTKKNFQSRRYNFKTRLTKRMVVHMDSSDVVLYTCTLCSYTAKQKDILRNHIVTHRDAELESYICHLCPYNSKRRGSLRDHLLTHRNCSEIRMYNCEVCSFQTKYKNGLSRHMILHKDPTEVTMYKCEFCPFKSKIVGSFKRHMIIHKKEAILYTCDVCLYKTKFKGDLPRHMLIHKDASKVKMFKCDGCMFETRHRSALKRHSANHKDPWELSMYKCTKCSYEAKTHGYLNRHMKRHK